MLKYKSTLGLVGKTVTRVLPTAPLLLLHHHVSTRLYTSKAVAFRCEERGGGASSRSRNVYILLASWFRKQLVAPISKALFTLPFGGLSYG